jgi:hypothetical protein
VSSCAHADRLAPLAIELDLPEPQVPMSAAAELAVYRIATEARPGVEPATPPETAL